MYLWTCAEQSIKLTETDGGPTNMVNSGDNVFIFFTRLLSEFKVN